MGYIKIIGRNTYKMTLKELCDVMDMQGNNIIFSVKIINDDYRMPQSNVDKYISTRFQEKCKKEKVLCKK